MTSLNDIKEYIKLTPENTNPTILIQMVQDYSNSCLKELLKDVNATPEVVGTGYYFLNSNGLLQQGTATIQQTEPNTAAEN